MSNDAYEYLLNLPRFAHQGEAAYRHGLERIRALLAEMGDPHRAFDVVHVAGTNGKGSTASMLAAILTAYGHRTGLHTSPHLLDVTERMRVDGAPAPREWLVEAVDEWKATFDRYRPSFFEATVALSFLYFAREDVDWAVVEVGMGGRLDATNVVMPELALITHIGLDHTQWLGDSLAAVAREKGGIIKDGVPVCVGDLPAEALTEIRGISRKRKAELHVVSEETSLVRSGASPVRSLHVETPRQTYPDLVVELSGRHQQANAVLALRSVELILPSNRVRKRSIYEGLAHVSHLSGLRGRMERIVQEPPIIVDVAHNTDGLRAVLESLGEIRSSGGRFVVVLGVMADKDTAGLIGLLEDADAEVWPVELEGKRAKSASALKQELEQRGVRVVDGPGEVASAIQWFRTSAEAEDLMLATGSHQVAAAALQTGSAANT